VTATLLENIQCAFRGLDSQASGSAEKCAEFLQNLYGQTTKKSGEPCLQYVSSIARRLSFYKLDYSTVMAALIWSVFQVKPEKKDDVKRECGQEVWQLASRLADLAEIDVKTSEEAENEKLRRLILALAKDVRVVFLRLIDRAHVLNVIDRYAAENPVVAATAVRDIYAPLANRLGIHRLKNELEDSSLRILKPQIYSAIRRRVKERSDHHALNMERIKNNILVRLDKENIRAEIKGRIKSIDSIYRKLKTQKIDFEQVYDVIGLRVITEKESVQDCYAVLGLIHSLWRPVPHRFKDFVANPKENGYQSIHTSVVGPKGMPIEVQIRTPKMDEVAEVGIAAHWQYKEADADTSDASEKFTWLRKAMEYLMDNPDSKDMIETFKVDMFPAEVYVFTPKGDVKSLPAGSTVIDFAFSIHTEVGFHCRHGKVNHKLVPLKTRLRNGDIVQIITSRNAHPNADWLEYVRTSAAKNKIRGYLRDVARDSMIKTGRETLLKEMKKQRIPIKGLVESDAFLELVAHLKFNAPDDLFAALGFGDYSVQQVINRLITLKATRERDLKSGDNEADMPRTEGSVRVISGTEIVTRFARCCEPEPGEKIVGYITRGRGITIHSYDCPSLKKLGSERFVEVRWDADDNPTYPVRIRFEGYPTETLSGDILRAVSDCRAFLMSQHIEMLHKQPNRIRGILLVEIQDGNEADRLIKMLKDVDGITDVALSKTRQKKRDSSTKTRQ
jgi:GTP diphosphokinase / guanosine-3',5'-bis(diphosphate) 3'-diphosphatase